MMKLSIAALKSCAKWLPLCLLPIAFASQADDCAPQKIDVWVKASFALSGDTIIIQNNEFRLIGIEAPQIQKNKNSIPAANRSRKSRKPNSINCWPTTICKSRGIR